METLLTIIFVHIDDWYQSKWSDQTDVTLSRHIAALAEPAAVHNCQFSSFSRPSHLPFQRINRATIIKFLILLFHLPNLIAKFIFYSAPDTWYPTLY